MPPSEKLTDRIVRIETQLERIISDIESEKETRSRVNSQILASIKEVHTETKSECVALINELKKEDIKDLKENNKKFDKAYYVVLGVFIVLHFILVHFLHV